MGETVTDLSQRLLAHHGGLRGLLRLDVVELALRDRCFSQRPARRVPGRSIAGARPGHYHEQHTLVVLADKVIQIEPKAELMKRTGKSPDFAESLMLTFTQGPPEPRIR